MAQFIEIPPGRLPAQTLHNLLQEYASRDGTDYGEREYSLEEKVAQLRRQLDSGELCLLYDSDSEQWDLAEVQRARELLDSDSAGDEAASREP